MNTRTYRLLTSEGREIRRASNWRALRSLVQSWHRTRRAQLQVWTGTCWSPS